MTVTRAYGRGDPRVACYVENWSVIRGGGLFVAAGFKTLLDQDLAGSEKP
jgi:hypothetical protein